MKIYLRSFPVFFKKYHGAFYLPIFTIYFILCAWTYSVSYFKTIGIPISYSPTENLIFIFEKARNWQGSLIKEVEPVLLVYIFIVLLLTSLIANVILKIKKKFWGDRKSTKLSFSPYDWSIVGPFLKFVFSGSQPIVSKLLTLALPIWILSSLNFSVFESSSSKILAILILIGLFVTVRTDFTNRNLKFSFYYVLTILVVFAPIGIIALIGKFDGLSDYSKGFSNNIKVCDYTKSDDEVRCGRLILNDTDRTCILFDSQKMISCQKGGNSELVFVTN